MSAHEPTEGVIKFEAIHTQKELRAREHGHLACQITAWRAILARTGLVGQDPMRYDGAGYGNVSGRFGAPSSPPGRRSFLVTGTQTGGAECIDLDDYAAVHTYDIRENHVRSSGMTLPSSEAMTHGAIYDLSSTIRFVFHGHCPVIWQRARELRIPTTDPSIAYGTPAMAREVGRLYRDGTLSERRVLAMGGHEDGVVVFGPTPNEAGAILISTLADAYALVCAEQGGGLCPID
jgi:ribulose-5-phosphate 4-epimerase/fuculose-1-phosphate aldolase